MSRTRTLPASRNMDLTPIMGLVAILIPLLLMAYGPAEVVVIDTSIPAICSGACTGEPEPEIVTPHIRIDRTGFVVGGLAAVPDLELDEQGQFHLPCAGGGCSEPGAYALVALNNLMSTAKDAFPDSTAVTLVPTGAVPYEVLVGTMDATREALPMSEGGERRALFPYPTIAGGLD